MVLVNKGASLLHSVGYFLLVKAALDNQSMPREISDRTPHGLARMLMSCDPLLLTNDLDLRSLLTKDQWLPEALICRVNLT